MLCPGGLTGNRHGKQPLACMYTAFRRCVPRRVYTPWDVAIYRLTEPLPAFPFDFFCPGTLLDLEQGPGLLTLGLWREESSWKCDKVCCLCVVLLNFTVNPTRNCP